MPKLCCSLSLSGSPSLPRTSSPSRSSPPYRGWWRTSVAWKKCVRDNDCLSCDAQVSLERAGAAGGGRGRRSRTPWRLQVREDRPGERGCFSPALYPLVILLYGLSQGTLPPKISNVRVHRGEKEEDTAEGDSRLPKQVFLDFDLEYLGDCDLRVSILGIPSGVR